MTSNYVLIYFIEKMATFTSNEEVINAYQSEPVLWDTVLNATEEEKELAWRRLCDLFLHLFIIQ